MNEMQSHRGVDVGKTVSSPFSSTTDHFRFIAKQDFQHLCEQPNSVDDDIDTGRKHLHCQIFEAITRLFAAPKNDQGPFKLIYDDFRLGNILVTNNIDFRIVVVLDREWAYAGPHHMLYSPPRWLLIKKPIDWNTEDRPCFSSQYKYHFQKFFRILEEEEEEANGATVTTPAGGKMSTITRWSMDDGKFWFRELIHSCFESPDNPAWKAFPEILPNLDEFATVSNYEVEAFVEGKMYHLQKFEIKWAAMKKEIDRMNAEVQALEEKIEKEDTMMKLVLEYTGEDVV